MKPILKERTSGKVHLTMRPPTMDDIEAAVDLFNRCSLDLVGVREFERQDIEVEWQAPGFELGRQARVAVTGEDQLVGYIEVWDRGEPHVQLFAWGGVDPRFRGIGIGSRLLRFAETRAMETISKSPPKARVSLRTSTVNVDQRAKRLFLRAGYLPIRHFYHMMIEMNKPPKTPHWPRGVKASEPIQVRAMEPGEEAMVVQAVREAFRDHWGYVEIPFAEEYRQWMHRIENDESFDRTLWFLGMDGDEIAGMSLCRPKRKGYPKAGWVGTLGVRRPWRRRGLALALLQHSFGEFYARGKQRVGLGVDSQNLTGATRLYEKAGMHVIRQYDSYEKELRPGVDLSTQSVTPE